MFVDGYMLTRPTMDRLSPGPLGVRTCDRSRCFEGYTLFSSAFGHNVGTIKALLVDGVKRCGRLIALFPAAWGPLRGGSFRLGLYDWRSTFEVDNRK